ncbi:MAG: pseudouridine synthase [Lachnospiraceae bacterium]|nr:pseudouridine synthase [Lachnospiraceae bacterium]
MAQGIRINKYIADAGVCSRRDADILIKNGKVTIDGRVALCGDKVTEGMSVLVNGRSVELKEKKVYLAYNKPKGVVCTSEKREKDNIIDLINYPVRITYAGRLDKDSEGLILLTNDGDLIDGLMRGSNMHEKEYEVTVDKKLTNDFIKALRAGVYLEELELTTRSCKVRRTSDRSFNIILTQGLNRQIKRMCRAFDYHVRSIKRIRINNIELGKLKRGQYRDLTEDELRKLMSSLREDNDGQD